MSGRAGPGQTHFHYVFELGPFLANNFHRFSISVSFFQNFIWFSNLVGWYRCNRRCDLPYRNIRRDYDPGEHTDVFDVEKDQVTRRENGDFR